MTERDSGGQPLSPAQRRELLKRLLRERRQRVLPASFGQERLWLLDKMGAGAAYNLVDLLQFRGELQVSVLARSLDAICQRHQVLRTTFVSKKGMLRQVIRSAAPRPLPIIDLSGLLESRRVAAVESIATDQARMPFDLTHGPLMRSLLLRLAGREGDRAEHILMLAQHHIITDGSSQRLLFGELVEHYRALRQGRQAETPVLPIQYSDYARRQRRWAKTQHYERQLSYWKKQLGGDDGVVSLPVLELPTDRPRPAVQTFRGACREFALSSCLSSSLADFARRRGVTLHMVLLSTFQVLLARHAGQEKVVVGTPVSGRDHLDLENLIGFFVNSLAVPTDLSGDPTVEELLQRVKGTLVAAYDNQEIPFEKLVEELSPRRDLSRNPLFQVVLTLIHTPIFDSTLPGDLEIQRFQSVVVADTKTSRFDLQLNLFQGAEEIRGRLIYNPDLFDATTSAALVGRFTTLLAGLVRDPGSRLSRLPVSSDAQRCQLLVEWNDTARRGPAESFLHTVFEQQAVRTPERIAISAGSRQLSYGVLDRRSSRLARFLRARGLGPETRVAVFMQRCPEMVVGFLGVLKADAAYVPLDPTSPRQRLEYLLADSGARLVLTSERWASSLPDETEIVRLDTDWQGIVRGSRAASSAASPAPSLGAGNPAYVIYTSGSTGRPKGVVVSHRNVVNFLASMARRPGLSPADVLLAVTTPSFDISVLELFGPLAAGARGVIAGHAQAADGQRLMRLLSAERASVMQATPATWQLLLQVGWPGKPDLKLLCGGEALPRTLAAGLVGRGGELWNLYGPTETTVWSTVSRIEDGAEPVNVGRPIDNTRVYVLDAGLRPVPRGAVGELFLGGAGVARGYHERPRLTAAQFLPDPFHRVAPGRRLYRTGDLVHFDARGRLLCIGRADHQVKLRGFRIELGEIEAALSDHDAVDEAVVLCREDPPRAKELVAYLTSVDPDDAPAPAALRRSLGRRLPPYMVPSRFVVLDKLPLTPSGKIDRRALPRPSGQRQAAAAPVAPRTASERAIVGIWRRLLGVDEVGVEDNFFELGGHSLLATQMVSRIRETFGVELPLQEIFTGPTVAALAVRIEELTGESGRPRMPPIPPLDREPAHWPLSFAQQRLWILDRLGAGSAYHNALTLRLSGPLNVAALHSSLQEIVARHEILRSILPLVGGEPRQVIRAVVDQPLPVVDLTAVAAEQRNEEARRRAAGEIAGRFDLTRGPLLRSLLLRLASGEHLLVLTMHHIVFDGWSLDVLQRELGTLYAAFSRGQAPALAPLPVQYIDFAVWQRRWFTGRVWQQQLGYWQQQLAAVAPLELPTDRPRPAKQTFTAARQRSVLPGRVVEAIDALSWRSNATRFMTLLAAFAVVLGRHSGQEDVVVGTPIANRNHLEVEPLIGFFVNSLVMRSDLSGNPTFRTLVSRVKDCALGAFAHQDFPFEHLVEELQPERDLSRSPLFQVTLVFQNAQPRALVLPGLEVSRFDRRVTTTHFDLELHAFEVDGAFAADFVYNTDLFDAATIGRLALHYRHLLHAATADPQVSLSRLPLLGAAQRHQLVHGWNDTASRYPQESSICELFEAQAAERPEAVALACDGRQLTYAGLDQRANRLARYLIRSGGLGAPLARCAETGRPDVEALVGLCCERGLEMMVGILGILKAGAAYVPLDPDCPRPRLELMLDDTGARTVVTQQRLAAAIPVGRGQVIRLDADWPEIAVESGRRPATTAAADRLAYVIYTSGSTGRPKGACITHRNVVRLVRNTNYMELGPDEVFLQFAPTSFDASTLELWGSLLQGARLVVPPPAPPSLAALGRTIRRHRITTLWLTSALFQQMVDAQLQSLRSVRQLLAGGETLPVPHVERMLAALSADHRLINGYGPTENTTFTCCHPMTRRSRTGRSVPIGRPIANTRVYLLDRSLNPAPLGVAGEVMTGGDGLARCYLNDPALTAGKLVPDPFSETAGARLYKIGDRARYLADGSIEFLGRSDHQVKIRGFRIELGEIEAMLSACIGVTETVVTCREDVPGDKRLVAYVVCSDGDLAPAALKLWLGERLPAYMVPSAFVMLDELPLNANGKIDRRVLPPPDGERQAGATFVSPRSDLERQIAAVWREVLGVDEIGVRDRFFDLGGHSLRLLQVQTALRQRLGREVPAADLFRYPTVETLAARLADEASPKRSLQQAAAARLGRGNRSGGETIAIVAIAGRFPGAPELETFWQNLRDGVESIRVFTDEELRAAGVQEVQLSHPDYVKARAALEGVDLFDAWFFGYTPREAELIDPQQRLFLECAWQALELAGCDPARYDGLIGVWAGTDVNRYLENLRSHPEILAEAGGHQMLLASGTDFLPTRVSYKLNLKGPSVNVQTACSTSLVAVHEACEALRGHRCDMALAGGVSVSVPRIAGYLHLPGGILSPDGHCRSFDARANGTLGADGVGIVVLKRLADAQRDGDRICALIRGTATNNDGARKVGFTAPSVDGQAEVIALAQASAGIEPETVTYVEAHGTATALGDPIEVAALQRVFGEATGRRGFCALGSLKSNIGHLSAAAGIGGMIKAVLALQNRQLPPSLHYQQPNPEIDFENSAFYVNAELKTWRRSAGTPRRAGVSSFGLGGTNAHAVLEEAPSRAPAEAPSRPEQLLVLSAKTATALARAAENLAAHLEQRGSATWSLADVAWTQQSGRAELEHRRSVVAASAAGACAALRGERRKTSSIGRVAAGRHDVVFLFPGQGAQYVGMGRELFEREAAFREAVDRCCELLSGELDTDLREILYPAAGATEETSARLKRTCWAQPALFVTEYALAEQWRSWGIEPSACAGHSVGELVAACVSGVLGLQDALRLVALRGRLMEAMPAGVMTAVPLSAADVESRLAEESGLWLSAVNGPSLCVVTGTEERVAAWERARAAEGVDCRRQHTSHAFHSALMEGAVAPFVDAVRTLPIGEPRLPYVSNVTGTWITAEEVRDPTYWGRHIRQAVRFSDGLDILLAEEKRVLLEVGPGQVLSTLARQQPRWSRQRLAVPSLRRPDEEVPDVAFLLGALGRLWTGGVSVAWQKVHGGERRLRVELPSYPFERQRFWIERQRPGVASTRSLARLPAIDDWLSVPFWRQAAAPPVPAAAAPGERRHTAGVCRWLLIGGGTPEGEAALRALRFAGAEVDALAGLPARGAAFRLAEHLPERIVVAGGTDAASRPVALFELARALKSLDDGVDREVVVVCSDLHAVTGEETRDPAAAAMDAMARVMAQELPLVRCRTIDLGAGVSVQALAAELLAGTRQPVVALRRQRRWSLVFEPMALGIAAGRLAEEGKVYLITGGLGRIGLALAESLARDAPATLVLSSRTPLETPGDGDQRDRVRAIEALGATVLVMPADVSDPLEVAQLVQEIEGRCGRLDGVVHAAGLTAGSSLRAVATLDAAACDAQLGPKLRGLVALDEALRGRRLDFRVATSSISTVLGGLELGAYAAANAAMEAAAAASPDCWRTIALDGWAFETEGSASVPARSDALRFAMAPEEGVEATRRAIQADAGIEHLVVSTADVEARIERWVTARPDGAEAPSPAAEGHARPMLSTEYATPETPTQRTLVEFWQEVLGIEQVGVDDDFFELGGHSLLATQAVSRMRERFQIALPVRAVFQYPTAAELAEEIERIRWAAGGSTAERNSDSNLVAGKL